MKTIRFIRRSLKGSIVVFALVILAVSSIVLAGWVHLLGAQAEYSSAQEDAIQRRLTAENSRALAVQYVREGMLNGSALSGVTNDSVTWGGDFVAGVRIPTFGSGTPFAATNFLTEGSPFSPAGASAYGSTNFLGYFAQVTNARIYSGSNNYTRYTLQARSRAPIFGFTLADLVDISSDPSRLDVQSSAVVGTTEGPKDDGDLLNVAVPPQIPSTFTMPTLGTNVAFGPSTLSVTRINSGMTHMNGNNSDRNRRLWTGTNGSSPNNNIATLFIYRRPYRESPIAPVVYNITNANTREIRFDHTANQGSDYTISSPENAPPVFVQCSSTWNPLTITVPSGNERQIYLRLAYTTECHVYLSGNSSDPTRLAGVFSGTGRLTFRIPDDGTIRGGFQTWSGSVRFRNQNNNGDRDLMIERETASLSSFQLLEFMAHRNGWVEIFPND